MQLKNATFFIVWILQLWVFAIQSAGAQDQRLAIRAPMPDTIMSLEQTLTYIEEKTRLYFSYNPELIKLDQTYDWRSDSLPVSRLLDRICRDQEVDYTLVGNQIVIHPMDETGAADTLAGKQESMASFNISGRVLSANKEEPIPYANIYIPESWTGTVANLEGLFSLSLPADKIPDSIAFSCMGFKTRMIATGELEDSLNEVHLEPMLVPIQEVMIRRFDPVHLLKNALGKVPENYFSQPVVETAFYRETILKNGDYKMVSEAVIDIYKPGIASQSFEQVRLLKGRKNNHFQDVDTVMMKLKGGLQTSLLLDFVRNTPEFLNPAVFPYYTYRFADVVMIQDEESYVIEFEKKPSTVPPHYQGRIYIDINTLAFRGMEFMVDPRTIERTTHSVVLKKPRGIRVRPLSASYLIRYQSTGDKFHLSLVKADNRFRVRKKGKLFGNTYRTISEMAITDLQTEEVNRFRWKETTPKQDIFEDLLAGYDPSFWGPYNYLIPEESLEDALARINQLMENQETADRSSQE